MSKKCVRWHPSLNWTAILTWFNCISFEASLLLTPNGIYALILRSALSISLHFRGAQLNDECIRDCLGLLNKWMKKCIMKLPRKSKTVFKRLERGFPGCSVVKKKKKKICLPMQEMGVPTLIQEGPTCHRTTNPMCHNYWSHVLQLLKPMCLEPVFCNKRSHCNEKPSNCNERVAPAHHS